MAEKIKVKYIGEKVSGIRPTFKDVLVEKRGSELATLVVGILPHVTVENRHIGR